MLRYLLCVVCTSAVLPSTLFGASIQLIDGLPGSYVPGEPVAFDVRLPAISNLGSYNIDLVLEGTAGVAGTDYYFDVAATAPALTSYVFPASANFFDTVTKDSDTRHRLTLTDFDFVGANVVPGTNDRVATVVFQTAASFRGQLDLFVDAPLLILDTPDQVPMPVQGFEELRSSIPPPVRLDVVPEPASLWSVVAGLGLIPAYRIRKRH